MHVLSSCTGNFLKHGCNAFLVASSPSFSLSKRHQLKQSACKENFAKVIFYFFYLLHYNYRPVKIFVRSTDFLSCMHLYNNFNKKKSQEISEKRRAFWKNSWNKSSTDFGKEGFECCMMNWVHLFLSSGQHIFSILIQQIIRSCAFVIKGKITSRRLAAISRISADQHYYPGTHTMIAQSPRGTNFRR